MYMIPIILHNYKAAAVPLNPRTYTLPNHQPTPKDLRLNYSPTTHV